MKIDDLSKNINTIQHIDTSVNKNIESGANKSESGSEQPVPQGEKIELSSASIEFSKAAKYMDNVSKDRTQRIEDLKMKVNNGAYEIESEKIAEGIIKDILTSM